MKSEVCGREYAGGCSLGRVYRYWRWVKGKDGVKEVVGEVVVRWSPFDSPEETDFLEYRGGKLIIHPNFEPGCGALTGWQLSTAGQLKLIALLQHRLENGTFVQEPSS